MVRSRWRSCCPVCAPGASLRARLRSRRTSRVETGHRLRRNYRDPVACLIIPIPNEHLPRLATSKLVRRIDNDPAGRFHGLATGQRKAGKLYASLIFDRTAVVDIKKI